MVSDGLFVKFNAGSKIQISFRLLGTSIDKLAAPLLLLHPPPTLSHTPSEAAMPSPQSMCVCASRAGLDMMDIPLPSPTSTSAPPANFSLQALIELKAFSCFCTPALRSVLSDTPAGGGAHRRILNDDDVLRNVDESSQVEEEVASCIGCCRPLCYGEYEQFTGCPAGRFLTTVTTRWKNETLCQRCAWNSWGPMNGVNSSACKCNSGQFFCIGIHLLYFRINFHVHPPLLLY